MIDQMQERITALTEENRALKDKIDEMRGIVIDGWGNAHAAEDLLRDLCGYLDVEAYSQFATGSTAQFAGTEDDSCAPVCAWIMDRDDVDSHVDYMPTSLSGEVSR